MKTWFLHILQTILDTWFPYTCTGCGIVGTFLCKTCEGVLETARDAPEPWIYAPFSYHDETVQKIIRIIKSHQHEKIFAWAGHHCTDTIKEVICEHNLYHAPRTWILVPIPISKKRLHERGFNQALQIAKQIQKHAGYKCVELLVRTKLQTKKQALTKSKKERLENMKGAFCAAQNAPLELKQCGIILIDDVTTTGATLREAKKVLQKAGYKKVIACAVAFQPLGK